MLQIYFHNNVQVLVTDNLPLYTPPNYFVNILDNSNNQQDHHIDLTTENINVQIHYIVKLLLAGNSLVTQPTVITIGADVHKTFEGKRCLNQQNNNIGKVVVFDKT